MRQFDTSEVNASCTEAFCHGFGNVNLSLWGHCAHRWKLVLSLIDCHSSLLYMLKILITEISSEETRVMLNPVAINSNNNKNQIKMHSENVCFLRHYYQIVVAVQKSLNDFTNFLYSWVLYSCLKSIKHLRFYLICQKAAKKNLCLIIIFNMIEYEIEFKVRDHCT